MKDISKWEKEYLTMNKNLNDREKEILNGSELKSHECMIFGRMYSDWKSRRGDNDIQD